jgi:transposase
MAPVVEAYQAMRGASYIVAVTFAAEIGDVRRFETPRQLMSFLGLVSNDIRKCTGGAARKRTTVVAGVCGLSVGGRRSRPWGLKPRVIVIGHASWT